MRLLLAIAVCLLLAGSGPHAQPSQPKVTPIIDGAPISGRPDKVFVLVSIEWPSGSVSPKHTHPGDEYGMVATGAYALKIGDADWKDYKAGESFHVPAGAVHQAKTTGFGTRTVHAYILEKGKPQIQLIQP
jgi:quercetin dioxygenase-like cupin family protein